MLIHIPLVSSVHLSQLCPLPSSHPAYSLWGRQGRERERKPWCSASTVVTKTMVVTANAKCCSVWTAVKKLNFITSSQPDPVQAFFQNTSYLAYTWFQLIIASDGVEWIIGGSAFFLVTRLLWFREIYYSFLRISWVLIDWFEGVISPLCNYKSSSMSVHHETDVTEAELYVQLKNMATAISSRWPI